MICKVGTCYVNEQNKHNGGVCACECHRIELFHRMVAVLREVNMFGADNSRLRDRIRQILAEIEVPEEIK